jgi:hypothetical protein
MEPKASSSTPSSNPKPFLYYRPANIVLDNAHNHGGIFDITTTTLLSTITDPAPGIVKHMSKILQSLFIQPLLTYIYEVSEL